MRVGYVLKRFPRLSQTFVLSELLELERAGVDVVVFAGRDSGGEDVTHPGVARLRAPIHYVGPGEDAPLRVAAIAVEGGVTHLHAHFAGWATRVAAAAGSEAGLPYSVTAHATDIYGAGVDRAALGVLLAGAAFVVTVTDANAAWLSQVPGAREARVVRIYNGIDSTAVEPGPPAARRTRQVLAVGRLVPKKGFDDLVRVTAELAHRGTEVDVRVVGDGPEGTALRGLAAELGVGDLVRFTGPADSTEVARAMRAAAVLVVPSVVTADGDQDALPTVVLEAMAAGLPVVATDINGLPEMVVDGVSGLVVPSRDTGSLAVAVEGLLADPVLRDRLATAARARLEQVFDLRRNVGQLADLFAGVRS